MEILSRDEIDKVNKLAEEMALKELNGYRGLGFCHAVWRCKKKILKEQYNIDWRSPAELHPDIKFD